MVIKNKRSWWRFISRVLLLGSFALLLYIVITYAKGYRLDFSKKTLQSTGIIAVNSFPNAAKVYFKGQNGQEELKGVTSLNLSLPPGVYTVTIKKEGYTSVTKTITLKGELVQPVDALLFPINPSLSPLTNLGLKKAVQVDQTDSILLFTDTDNIEKDGIYIFESGKKALSFLPPLTPLLLKKDIPAVSQIDFSQSAVTFSYDYKQALIDFTVQNGNTISYLISLNTANQQPFDVTASRDTFLTAWEEEKRKETAKIVEALPREIRKVASDSFHIVSLSPDETKILYQAKAANSLPLVINPPLIGANQSPESRILDQNNYYVYDKKEDKNYRINKENSLIGPSPTTGPSALLQPSNMILNSNFLIQNAPLWYPDSKHFVIQHGDKITVIDYDGVNKQTVYSGPHENGFIGVNSEGKLLILINLNPDANKYPDLYSVGIR